MIVVQATPNAQPGGVHGALFKLLYHSDVAPEPINLEPIPKAMKLRNPKINILRMKCFTGS